MRRISRAATPALALALLASTAPQVEAQGRGNRDREDTSPAITLSVEVTTQIRAFYTSRPASGVETLPPGIRRRLEKGKALPPGIAKKSAPDELRVQVDLPEGYELVEVGLDVFLVEVATSIIHDVLMDIIR